MHRNPTEQIVPLERAFICFGSERASRFQKNHVSSANSVYDTSRPVSVKKCAQSEKINPAAIGAPFNYSTRREAVEEEDSLLLVLLSDWHLALKLSPQFTEKSLPGTHVIFLKLY
jgi:hypothetical protein